MILVLAACIMNPSVHAGGSSSFSLSFGIDLAIGLPALGMFGAGMLVEPQANANDTEWIDEDFTYPYSSTLEHAGTLSLAVGVLALPFLLDTWDAENTITLGVMFSQAALLTIGTKDLLKAAISRPRPYLDREDTPESLLNDEDSYASFPSGHTSLAFMSAAFCTYVYAQGNTSETGKWLMGISTFALATATSTLRVASGSHYISDVVAGAVLGSLIGIGVPLLHRNTSTDGITIAVQPLALSLTFDY